MQKYRLPLALLVLAALGIGSYFAVKGHTGETPESAAVEGGGLPDLKKDDVDSLEIRRPGEEAVKLEKKGTEWRVTSPVDAPADQEAAKSAVEKLDDLTASNVAAVRKENHAALEIDDAQAVRVTVRHGSSVIADLLVGATVGSNTMVRQAGKDTVYAVSGSIKWNFSKELKDWRDKKIVDVEANQVTGVSLTNSSGTLAFSKTGEDWQPAAGTNVERFSSSKTRALVSTFTRLRASDFAAAGVTAEQAGITETSPRVTLTVARPAPDGGVAPAPETIVLKLGTENGDEGDKKHYLMRDGDPVVYQVAKFSADKFEQTASDFQNPPDAGAAAAPPPGGGMEGMPDMGGMGGGSPVPQQMDPSKLPPDIRRQLEAAMKQRQAAPHAPH